jgi:hypothetical protein
LQAEILPRFEMSVPGALIDEIERDLSCSWQPARYCQQLSGKSMSELLLLENTWHFAMAWADLLSGRGSGRPWV